PYVLPLIQMVVGSLGGRGFANYKAVWDTGVVPTFFRNSAIISGGVILLVYIFSMTAGFGLGTPISFELLQNFFQNPIVVVLYVIGMWAAIFHFCNGITTFCMTWGITKGPR
ncbi:hypothetical protein, partial [Acinetobacter baumannii]|uniref:hypothetical protein n=1 Tax=Acinetobacter baumannii TaxID=470 RepID=UPI001BC87DCC